MKQLSQQQLYSRAVNLFNQYIAPGLSRDECWDWQGSLTKYGYGRINAGGGKNPNRIRQHAHRFSYQMHYKCTVSEQLVICHRCDNKRCVNPHHLFVGTQMDNIKDKIAKGRAACGVTHSIATRQKTPRGSANAIAKLVETDIPIILQMREKGHTLAEIGDKLGVTIQCISHVLKGKNWSHISGIPKKEKRFKELEGS